MNSGSLACDSDAVGEGGAESSKSRHEENPVTAVDCNGNMGVPSTPFSFTLS